MTTVHVVPQNDTIGHATNGDDCPCDPSTEAVFREDGSNGWIVVHRRTRLTAADYFATVRRLSSDPDVLAAVDRAEAKCG